MTAVADPEKPAKAGTSASSKEPAASADAPDPAATRRGRLDLDELAALEEQRTFLLTSIEDLEREHDAGDLDDDDYATLRADYTARAARVIEAIEERHEWIDATTPDHRGVRRLLVVAAVVLVAVVAGVVVTTTSGSRHSTQNTAGELKPSKATQACMDKLTSTFRAAANGGTNPNGPSEAIDALDCFSARIEADPKDAVAYTYRGWGQTLMARTYGAALPKDSVAKLLSLAQNDLTKARKLAPGYPDALTFSAISALWSGDTATAKADLAKIDALQLPANAPILGYVNGMLRPALQAADTASSTTAPAGAPSTTAPGTSAPAGASLSPPPTG